MLVVFVLFRNRSDAVIHEIILDSLAFFKHAVNKTESKFSYVELIVSDETVENTNGN